MDGQMPLQVAPHAYWAKICQIGWLNSEMGELSGTYIATGRVAFDNSAITSLWALNMNKRNMFNENPLYHCIIEEKPTHPRAHSHSIKTFSGVTTPSALSMLSTSVACPSREERDEMCYLPHVSWRFRKDQLTCQHFVCNVLGQSLVVLGDV